MAINFPNSPSDGQIFYDTTSGNRYIYSSAKGRWSVASNNSPFVATSNNQVLFNNQNSIDGDNGLVFDVGANTLTANTINAYSMRVTGNLYIGSNTVVISNNSISAEMINVTTVMVAGSAIPSGDQSNAMYVVANAAFGHTNTTLTHSQAVYGAVNSVFGVANAAFGVTNAAFGHSNTTYAAVNSAFDLANTKVSKSGDTITGTLSIVGDLIVSGNTHQINANTLSISDPLIYLAANNYSSDIVDIGFIANYVNTGGANVHTGLYREHENKEYYLFQGYDREPINNHIGALSNNMTLSVLNADIRTSNLNLGGANAITWISSGYGVANAAFAAANAEFTFSNTIYAAVNSAFGVINAAYTSSNADYVLTNAAFTAANAKVATVSGTSGRITSSGTTGITLDLATAGAGAASYSSGISALTVDAYGRVTAVTGSAGYLTDITSGQVTTALGYTPYNSTNPNGYITSSALSPYALLSGATFSGDVRTYRTASSTTGVYYFSQSGDYYIYWNGGKFAINGGFTEATGSLRSPIFYDSNDTGYYVDPNSTSLLFRLNVNGSSIASSGYTRLVNGMIIQWGSQGVNANSRTVYNFPIAFPTGCYGFAATGDWISDTGWATNGGAVVSASQYALFTVWDSGPRTTWWIAIGY